MLTASGKFNQFHPVAYAIGPVRGWTGVCDEERVSPRYGREKGRALPGPVVSTFGTPRMVPPPVGPYQTTDRFGFAYADLDTCRWGKLRAKGLVSSNFRIHIQIGRQVQKIGHFRCTGGPAVQILPRIIPAEDFSKGGRVDAAKPSIPERRTGYLAALGWCELMRAPAEASTSADLLDGGIYVGTYIEFEIPKRPEMKRQILEPAVHFF